MRHIKPFPILENSGIPNKITLYLYNNSSSSNMGSGGFDYSKDYVGFFAPNDDFMTSIFETKFERDNGWGDFEEYESRDDEGGHEKFELESTFDFYSQEDLDKVPGLDAKLIEIDPSITSIEDTEWDYYDLRVKIEEKTFKYFTFNAQKEAERYSSLTDDMREKLIVALFSMQKTDPRGLFSKIK